MKTRDGYKVYEGIWISDVNGIYEVKTIHSDNTVTVNLIEFKDDNSDDYYIADTLIKTKEEVARCEYL